MFGRGVWGGEGGGGGGVRSGGRGPPPKDMLDICLVKGIPCPAGSDSTGSGV